MSIWTIERFGRRKLMLFGSAGQAGTMAILAGVNSVTDNTALGWVAVAFLFVFNTFFAIGWLGMTWLYPSEIVPLHVRAPSSALSTSANWVCSPRIRLLSSAGIIIRGVPVPNARRIFYTQLLLPVLCVQISDCVY